MALMRKSKLLLIGAAVFVSGCATTSSQDVEDTVFTGFIDATDGSKSQAVLGLDCPARLEGFQLGSTYVYNPDGTDVSCNYAGPEGNMTVYLSRYPDSSLSQEFQAAVQAIESRFDPMGYRYDEKATDACAATTLDAASFMEGFTPILTGEDTSNTINLSTSPTAVFLTDTKVTFLMNEEMFEGEFYKTRYTGSYGGADALENVCQTARNAYLVLRKSVRENRGLEPDTTQQVLDELADKEGS
jgi:hypothetical protein